MALPGSRRSRATGSACSFAATTRVEPPGILHEGGCMLVDAAIRHRPVSSHANLKLIAADLLGLGLTGVHDPGELTGDTDVQRGPVFYRELAQRTATSARPFLGPLVAARPSNRARLPKWPVDRSLSDGLAEASSPMAAWVPAVPRCSRRTTTRLRTHQRADRPEWS